MPGSNSYHSNVGPGAQAVVSQGDSAGAGAASMQASGSMNATGQVTPAEPVASKGGWRKWLKYLGGAGMFVYGMIEFGNSTAGQRLIAWALGP